MGNEKKCFYTTESVDYFSSYTHELNLIRHCPTNISGCNVSFQIYII